MLGRNSSLGWRLAIAALSFIARCGAATAQGASPPPAVSVAPVVSRQVTETGDFIGRVTAIDKVDIVARVPGFIEERYFTEGQQVKTGDLLFRIEQATYKAAVEQQRANLAKAKATEVNAALQLGRGKELVTRQNIPQATVDQRAADEAAAQANVMAAQAMLDQAEINLGYTEIRSPIDGRIGIAIFTIGNLVDPSSGKLATIVRQDPGRTVFKKMSFRLWGMSKDISAAAGAEPHADPSESVRMMHAIVRADVARPARATYTKCVFGQASAAFFNAATAAERLPRNKRQSPT
jgi:membrane fusion protein, multidrug efflux system